MTSADMPHSDRPVGYEDLPPEVAKSIDDIADCFEHQLYTQGQPSIHAFLSGFVEPEQSILLRELLLLELETYLSRETIADRNVYLQRFPGHAHVVNTAFEMVFPGSTPTEPVIENARPQIPNYQILRPIGQGGMGTVYEAIHVSLASPVALKVMHRNLARNLEAEADFEREMKVIGSLSHPNIVLARDAGRSDGQRYLVMEYIEGLDLLGILQRTGPLPLADVCEIACRVALALDYAHQRKLVHRDIKPKNILLGRVSPNSEEAEVKVADFGLAVLRGYTSREDVSSTERKRVAGTLAYMAPEQFWNQCSDIRSDIYSLGCTCYCLLLGKPPFSRPQYQTPEEIITAHRDVPVSSVQKLRPDVNDTLDCAILKMLAKKPEDRFQTPKEVAELLKQFSAGHDLQSLLCRANESLSLGHRDSSFVSGKAPTGSIAENPPAPAKTIDYDGPPPSTPEPSNVEEETPPSSPVTPPRSRKSSIRFSSRQLLLGLGLAVLCAISAAWIMTMHGPVSIDLLESAGLSNVGVKGDWTRDGHALLSPDAPHACYPLPHPVPANYELLVEAKLISGGQLVLGLVYQGQSFPVVLGAAYAIMDSESASHSDVPHSSPAEDFGFSGGQPDTYTCLVTEKGILVAYEDEIRFLYRADEKLPKVDPQWQMGEGQFLFLGTHYSIFRFSQIILTPRGT